jgi:prepilin-type N-terminal cleavage/methylation domain-containing protein
MRKFLRRKPKMKWVFKKILLQNRRAFTLIEVTVALVILGMITATVLVVVNRAIDTVVLWQTKMQTFDIARENMEKILAQPAVSDSVEYGINEENPNITWKTTIESFYEPVTNNMWIRAVCSAEFTDESGQEQKVELTHWLTSLSKEQIQQILEQKQREKEYYEATAENPGQEQQTGQDQQATDAQTWKEMESWLGPPPEGYEHWGKVPQEQFWKAVMGNISKNK